MRLKRGGSSGLKTIYEHLGIPKEEFSKLSAHYEEGARWFHEHIAVLHEKHPGKYVAVSEGRIAAEDEDLNRLFGKLEKNGLERRFTFVGLVTPAPLDLI